MTDQKIMSEQIFLQAIDESLDSINTERRQDGEATLMQMLTDLNSINAFLAILSSSQEKRYKLASAVYLHKIIKKFWKMSSDDKRIAIQSTLFQILTNQNFSDDILYNFIDSIQYIYSHDERSWPELINFMFSIPQSRLCYILSMKLLIKMKVDVVEELHDFFMQVSLNALSENDLKTQLIGAKIFSEYAVMSNEKPYSNDHATRILNLILGSVNFTDEIDISDIWLITGQLSYFNYFDDETYMKILDAAFTIAKNKDFQPTIRYVPLYSLNEKIEYFNEKMIMELFTTLIDITADLMEQDQQINNETLEYFDTASNLFNHQQLYPIIQQCIMNALQSNLQYHQVAGILIFGTLLKKFPDLIYNEIDAVVNFLTMAYSSQFELLKQAALSVTDTFATSFKSSNAFTPKFLPLILPNLTSPIPETQHFAFRALYAILDTLDTKINGFLEKYLEISSQVSEENTIEYLSLLALVIISADDYSDEIFEQILKLINVIFEQNDIENLVASLDVASAILQQDDMQIYYIVEKFFPLIPNFLQQDNSTVINHTFDFLGNVAQILRENSFQYLNEFIPAIIQFLDNSRITNEVKQGIVINCSKIAKFCSKDGINLVDHIIPNILNGLKSDENGFQVQAASSIRKIKNIITNESSKALFDGLIKCLVEAVEYDEYINELLLSLGKLIIVSVEPNTQYFLDSIVQFIKSIFETKWELLNGTSIFEHPSGVIILPPLCHLFSAVFHYKTSINDTICQFLMEWMKKNNELDLFEITGTLADCLQFRTVSEDTMHQILNSIISIMGEANEPSLLQNLSFIMNMLVQNNPELLNNIIELIPVFEKWRRIGMEAKFGYQDVIANIASLYIQISIRAPQFPNELTIFAIEQFPPFDINETATMAQAIVAIVQNKNDPGIYSSSAMAFARYFVLDDSKLKKAKVDPNVEAVMKQLFKSICSQDQSVLMRIKGTFGKQKSKIRRIEACLNS